MFPRAINGGSLFGRRHLRILTSGNGKRQATAVFTGGRARLLAEKYCHDIEGYNGRLDAIQAGLLHVKLPYLPGWNASRTALAKRYSGPYVASRPLIVVPVEPL